MSNRARISANEQRRPRSVLSNVIDQEGLLRQQELARALEREAMVAAATKEAQLEVEAQVAETQQQLAAQQAAAERELTEAKKAAKAAAAAAAEGQVQEVVNDVLSQHLAYQERMRCAYRQSDMRALIL